jgi:3alpha(or 20beta)-hydroxysteroid dehydrogenase
MANLDHRVVLLTGGARGVGVVLARKLAQAGAHVVIGDRLSQEARSVADELDGTNTATVRAYPLDVAVEEDWKRIVESVLAEFGRIDVLVNNAAILHMGSIENTTPATFRQVLDINSVGPFLGTRAVLPTMKAQQKGSIVHISSIDGMIGMNGVTAYATSKWGLRGLAKSSALELGRHGIRVNTVCPATGNPEMFGPWMAEIATMGAAVNAYSENRAIPGSVSLEAIAEAVIYLASDASEHVTGIDLPVDGGAVAGRYIDGFSSL